jgi:hypothetical protein
MIEHTTTECLLFPDYFPKPVLARFDQENGSSDGGALLLRGANRQYGDLITRLSECLQDKRQVGKIDHSLTDLLGQRIYGMACGYPDANDAARVGRDPIHKLLLDRSPEGDGDLASQPTLSRFENTVGPKELYRMGETLADRVLERHAQRLEGKARQVIIDLDPTEDPTHGAQQLSFFNGHYDHACYLPVVGFVSFDQEEDQYLFTAVLRPGNAPAVKGAIGILRRVLPRVRGHFPGARILVRLDGGFAHPEVLEFLDSQPKVDYVVAMAKNAVLKRTVKAAMRQAGRLSRQSGKTEHLYVETSYAARSWAYPRRVIIKAEVVRQEGKKPKDNPRFVITNLRQSPQWIYEQVYCQRGKVENRIKELHDGLQMDRTSCCRFWANQLRVLMAAAGYILMQELRLCAAGTDCAQAQVTTLRERLLKLGARVVTSVRRTVVHFPSTFPYLRTFHKVSLALGALSG